ncbi:MAG TPA: PaaI family thioesterase [Acidimicrobiia bacterium]
MPSESIVDEPVRGAIGDPRGLQLPGLEAARRYVRGELPLGPIHRLTGLRPTDAGPGRCTFSMPVTRWLEDGFGVVWAGVFALLADAPLGLAIWTGLPAGKMVTTSELNMSFVRPITRETGNIVGRATSVHQGSQVGLAAVEVSDRNGRLMAYGTTRCLIVDAPVDLAAEYPEPDTGPDEPVDPYLREPPGDAYFDLETIVKGAPTDVLTRVFGGEVRPNIWRLLPLSGELEGPGSVRATFPTTPWFSAGAPFLYGGLLALFAESATGSAIYSTVDPGEVFATLDLNIRFTRPVPIGSGDITLRGQVQHVGRRLRVASADLFNAEGKRVAMATSSALVVPDGVQQLMRGVPPEEILGIR